MEMANATLLEGFPCDMTEIVDGNVELIFGPSDIKWHLERTSYATELDLYCDVGTRSSRKTLIASMWFVGALFGLIIGGYAWDHLGRINASMVGASITFLAQLLGMWCHNYSFLLVIRFFTGFGDYITYTGTYLIQMELTAVKYRTVVNCLGGIAWTLGYPLTVAIGYFNYDWNYMFLSSAILTLVCNLHVFFLLIESPRFYLVNNDMKAAKKSLKALTALTTANLDIDNIEIIDKENEDVREQTAIQQIKDLWTYPVLLKEGLCFVPMWFLITMFYYGFNFAWDMILPFDRFVGYIMAAVGEVIACFIAIPAIHWMGRRRSMMFFQTLAAVVFLIAIPDVDIGNDMQLESLCSLIGSIIVTITFYDIYLWTSELAPTSHRGFAFTVGSGAAKIGGFAGPFIFNNLGPSTNRSVPWILLAVLAFFCAFCAFLLVETAGREMVQVPADVQRRRKAYKYRI